MWEFIKKIKLNFDLCAKFQLHLIIQWKQIMIDDRFFRLEKSGLRILRKMLVI